MACLKKEKKTESNISAQYWPTASVVLIQHQSLQTPEQQYFSLCKLRSSQSRQNLQHFYWGAELALEQKCSMFFFIWVWPVFEGRPQWVQIQRIISLNLCECFLWSFCFTSLLLNCIFQIEEKERKYIHRAEEFIWFWINYSCIIKSCLLKLICWNRGPLVKMATFFSFYVLESCVFCCCDWTVVCSSQKMTVFQRAISAFINQTGRQYIKKKNRKG